MVDVVPVEAGEISGCGQGVAEAAAEEDEEGKSGERADDGVNGLFLQLQVM